MTANYANFESHSLDHGHPFFVGRLPEVIRSDVDGFEELWALHPEDYHVIPMHRRPVKTPGAVCLERMGL